MEFDLYALHERGNEMSLLTEEQFNDILDITNVCGTSLCATKLKEWNEKQQPAQPLAQFEPDWNEAPKNAKFWAIKEVWLDIRSNEIDCKLLTAHVKKPITPHPHAALIAKYAEVAARRPDPWAEFEMRIGGSSEWVKCDMPISFQNYWEYRHIGETK